MRCAFALICVGLLALGVTGAAFAAGPTREPVVLEPTSFDAGDVCSFPVTIESVVNREVVKDFGDHLIITGALVLRVTNDESGASVVLNASGPAKVVFTEDSATQYGRGLGLNLLFPGDLGPGSDGALLWTKGPMIQRFTEGGLEILRMAPKVTDVCALLAA